MAFMPCIHFDGTCAEAMTFYCKLFNGTDLQFIKYSDVVPYAGGLPSDRIMHSQSKAASAVMIDPPDVVEGQRRFDGLAAGRTVVMPFGPTGWSPGFGMMEDRFGTHWIIGTQPAA